MTKLIRTMKSRFHKDHLSLSLTIMSNTPVESYYDMPVIVDSLDFITLAAFDYSNPQETPSKADYFAPLYAPDKHHTTTNVNFTVQQWWTHHKLPFEKINLGIAVFARTWNTTKPLKDPKMPITKLLKGPAPGGYNTRTTGLLAWPEMCKKLSKITNVSKKNFGSFAYRPASPPNKQGLLITYDDLDSIREKVKFAQAKKLHGIALFDLSYDDFRGKCRGERYVMLKAIKKLLN
uniref:GH18 domain-containing protein n=1 Tax=Musca domestica TaxID=7370 RepID=A0A1I8MCJ5_MUSDO